MSKQFKKQKKSRNIILPLKIFMPAALITLMLSGITFAFHEGGAGYCEGCHVIQSQNNQIQDIEESTDIGITNVMLKGSDPSSTCLRCHAEDGKFYNVLSGDGSMYTPGGDFYWLKKTFIWNADGKFSQSSGASHGHNILAADYGLNEDSTSYDASIGLDSYAPLGCTSCHDPHQKTGNPRNIGGISAFGSYGDSSPNGDYRMLGGIGYTGGTNGNTFKYPAPVAVMNSYNWVETDSNHTAYGSGMSEWCGNCHNNFLNNGNKHMAENRAKFSSVIVSNYNSYKKTGDTTGTQVTAYLALVPFELGTTNKFFLNPSSISGPDPSGKSNVMCLTCHRAHASAFKHIGRWDFNTTFIADSHPKPGDDGVTGNDVLNSYYGRNMVAEFGIYQRQLCNKCHSLD